MTPKLTLYFDIYNAYKMTVMTLGPEMIVQNLEANAGGCGRLRPYPPSVQPAGVLLQPLSDGQQVPQFGTGGFSRGP